MREGIWLGMRMRTHEALIGTLAGVVKARTIRIQPEDEKWSAAMIREVRGTPRRPNPLVDDDNVPEDVDEITFDHRGHDDRDKDHEGKESQEPVPVRTSDIVPLTATEEAWRKHVRNEEVDNSVRGRLRGAPVARASERRMVQATRQNADSGLQNEMSTTREGKIKLDEEQKTERCLHSQKDDVGITRSSRRKSQ